MMNLISSLNSSIIKSDHATGRDQTPQPIRAISFTPIMNNVLRSTPSILEKNEEIDEEIWVKSTKKERGMIADSSFIN